MPRASSTTPTGLWKVRLSLHWRVASFARDTCSNLNVHDQYFFSIWWHSGFQYYFVFELKETMKTQICVHLRRSLVVVNWDSQHVLPIVHRYLMDTMFPRLFKFGFLWEKASNATWRNNTTWSTLSTIWTWSQDEIIQAKLRTCWLCHRLSGFCEIIGFVTFVQTESCNEISKNYGKLSIHLQTSASVQPRTFDTKVSHLPLPIALPGLLNSSPELISNGLHSGINAALSTHLRVKEKACALTVRLNCAFVDKKFIFKSQNSVF